MSDASIQTLIRADAAQILHNVVEELPDARERLQYVRSMTEQAATKVLNLVEAAQDPTLWPVQAAAIESLGASCAPAGRRVVRAGLTAENGQVVGAARKAVQRCGWTR